jgi:hypothetical protein
VLVADSRSKIGEAEQRLTIMDQDLLALCEAAFADVVDTLIANGIRVQRDGHECMLLPKFDGWFLVENDPGIRSDLIEDGIARFNDIVDMFYAAGLKNKRRFLDGREYLPLFGRWFPVDDKPRLAEALLADLRARTTLLVNGLSCTSP